MKTLEKNRHIRNKNIFKKMSWDGVPATVRKSLFESSLYESVFFSLCYHIAGILLIALLAFAFTFFGLNVKLFPKPKEKMHDIQFIIKDNKPHVPRKIQPVPVVEKTVPKEPVVAKKASSPQPSLKQPARNIFNQNPTKEKSTNQAIKHTKSGKAGSAKTKSHADNSAFQMPMPSLKSMSSGLGSPSGTGRHHAVGANSSNSSTGSFSSASSGGSSSSSGGGFDKAAAKKMITTFDISPYVNELRRNVRWHWKAPSSIAGKRVEIFIRIAKDGKIVILNVKKTSEIGEVDNAAIKAVRGCQPLSPLPSKYAKSYLDVVFTFDASTVGSRY